MLKRAVAVAEERLQVWTSWVLRAGFPSLLWPPLLGMCVGVGVSSVWPELARATHETYGLSVMVAFSGLLGVLSCGILALSEQGADNSWSKAAATLRRFALPLAGIPILVALASGLERRHGFLVLALAVLGGWVAARWLTEWLVHKDEKEESTETNQRTSATKQPWPLIVLASLLTVYTVVFSTLSLRNHWAFNTGRADLGFYVSIFRRSSLGDPLGCTICGGGDHLSGHFDPILVLLSPLYLVYPEAEAVLVLQSFLLGSAMIPLYLLAQHHGLGAFAALALSAGYGLHPALHGVNLFDFHSLSLIIPAALWLLWARDTERPRAYLGCLLLLLLVREDAALVAVFIGADTIFSRRRHGPLLGLLTILSSAAYFVFVKTALMSGGDPLNPGTGRGYAYYYRDLVPKNTGTGGLINSVLGDPTSVLVLITEEAKLYYWLLLLVPVLALPLVSPRGRLLLAYGAAFTLLASREFVYSPHFHYSSVVLPFLYYLAVLGFARVCEQRSRWFFLPASTLSPRRFGWVLAVFVLTSSALCSARLGSILPNHSFRAGFNPLARKPTKGDLALVAAFKKICRTLPNGASVAADGPHLPHLGRCSAYYTKQHRNKADYLVWRFGRGETSREIRREIKEGYWKPVANYGKLQLFQNHFPNDYKPNDRKPRSQRKKPDRKKDASPKKRKRK